MIPSCFIWHNHSGPDLLLEPFDEPRGPSLREDAFCLLNLGPAEDEIVDTKSAAQAIDSWHI